MKIAGSNGMFAKKLVFASRLPQTSWSPLQLIDFIEAWSLRTGDQGLWQDAARTIPVTGVGQPILVADPISGVATRRATSASLNVPVSSAQGVKRADTNDWLNATNTGITTSTNGITIVIRATMFSPPVTFDGLFSLSPVGGNDFQNGFCFFFLSGSNTNNLAVISLGAGNGTFYVNLPSPIEFGTPFTITLHISSTPNNSKIWVNGALVNGAIPLHTTSLQMQVASFLCRYETQPARSTDVAINRVAMKYGLITEPERAECEAWVASPYIPVLGLFNPDTYFGSRLTFALSPSTITGLSDNAPVPAWSSTGQTVMEFSNSIPAERPVYRTQGDGGKPFVSWSGLSSAVLHANAPSGLMGWHNTEGVTFLTSIKRNTTSRATILGNGNISSYPQLEMLGNGASIGIIEPGVWAGNGGTAAPTDRILSMYRTGNPLLVNAEVNGSIVATNGSVTTGIGTGSYTLTIGQRTGVGSQPLNSDIYDLRCVRGFTTLTERQLYHGWAAWQFDWVNLLPINHPFKAGPPKADGSPEFLLDGLVDIPTAYSPLRKLRTEYNGPLVRLTRSSDGVVRDFWPVLNGCIDKTDVLSWAGAGDARITLAYDQSGRGDHATPGVNLVFLVVGGVWQNGFRKNAQNYSELSVPTAAFSGATSMSASSIYSVISGNPAPHDIGAPGGGLYHYPWTDGFIYTGFGLSSRPPLSPGGVTVPVGPTVVTDCISSSGALTVYFNGTVIGSITGTFATPTQRTFPGGGQYGACVVRELILQKSLWSPELRQKIVLNQQRFREGL